MARVKTQRSQKILAIASFADDRIVDARIPRITRRLGGPARWISHVLRARGLPFTLASGRARTTVRITVSNGDERGSVGRVVAIRPREGLLNRADVVLVSTLADEFDLRKLAHARGIIALDIQGYARHAAGEGQHVIIPPQALRNIAIIKATVEELERLPPAAVRSQKWRILIVTRGARGFTVYARGRRHDFPVRPLNVRHAVGAGDVLFTAFTIEWERTRNVRAAGLAATRTVATFLKRRAIPHEQ